MRLIHHAGSATPFVTVASSQATMTRANPGNLEERLYKHRVEEGSRDTPTTPTTDLPGMCVYELFNFVF